jgi:hypothetical protein
VASSGGSESGSEARSGVFRTGEVGGWPVWDASVVVSIVNSLSRNGIADAALFVRLSQHLQVRLA